MTAVDESVRLSVAGSNSQLAHGTCRLLGRMLGPVTGLCQEIGFMLRGPLEPRMFVAGGDMTGVHMLRGQPPPAPGAYHIGGSGTTYNEAIISTLGETVERYAQYISVAAGRHPVTWASAEQLRRTGECRVLIPERFEFFTDEQLARRPFPFFRLAPSDVIGWIRVPSLVSGCDCWAPAQQLLVGYLPRENEPRYMIGVTTGTSAHTSAVRAFRGALLELIQIDAAMGHWYGRRDARLLRLDRRTRRVQQLIHGRLHPFGAEPRFYWLPSPELPGFAIACVLQGEDVPRAAVGLGCELNLERAVYKSFLEAVAVAQLAKVVLFRRAMEPEKASFDPGRMFDLDSNVGYYAEAERPALGGRFGDTPDQAASELPADGPEDDRSAVRQLVGAFRETGKELVFMDLTTSDIRALGFTVVRVWSPDTLSLSLPSAPPLMHARFDAYGGVGNDSVHPYP